MTMFPLSGIVPTSFNGTAVSVPAPQAQATAQPAPVQTPQQAASAPPVVKTPTAPSPVMSSETPAQAPAAQAAPSYAYGQGYNPALTGQGAPYGQYGQ